MLAQRERPRDVGLTSVLKPSLSTKSSRTKNAASRATQAAPTSGLPHGARASRVHARAHASGRDRACPPETRAARDWHGVRSRRSVRRRLASPPRAHRTRRARRRRGATAGASSAFPSRMRRPRRCEPRRAAAQIAHTTGKVHFRRAMSLRPSCPSRPRRPNARDVVANLERHAVGAADVTVRRRSSPHRIRRCTRPNGTMHRRAARSCIRSCDSTREDRPFAPTRSEVERLSLAHHRVGFVQQRQHLRDAPRVEMRGGVLQAEEAQRAHRVAGIDRLRRRRRCSTTCGARGAARRDLRCRREPTSSCEKSPRRRRHPARIRSELLRRWRRAKPSAAEGVCPSAPARRGVAEVPQKHIGDLFRSPISGNPFLEGAFKALGKIVQVKQTPPAPPFAPRLYRRASPASTRRTSSPATSTPSNHCGCSSSGPSIW